jgi:MFS family permease
MAVVLVMRQRLLGWLPESRGSRRFLVVSFVDAIGTGLFLAGSALFFTRVVGLSSAQVGAGLTCGAVAGFACSVALGKLADRVGSRRMVIVLYLWRGSGFVAYLFVDDFVGFVVVASLLGASQWAMGPIIQAMVGAAEEGAIRIRTMAAMNVLRNVGFVIGALLATVAIASGNRYAYRSLIGGDALSFFLAAVLLARTPVRAATAATAAAAARAPGRVLLVRDVRYILLAAGNGVLFLHPVLLSVGLPLWISTRAHAPASLVGVVVVVNTVLAVALGVRLSRGVDGVAAGGARQHWAGWSLAACCVLVSLTAHVGGVLASLLLLAAAAALTLGELWQSTGQWALSYALSPEDRRGYYMTVFNLGEPIAAIAGPVVLTVGVMHAGSAGWLCLGAAFAATGVLVRAVAARAERPPAPEPTTRRIECAS